MYKLQHNAAVPLWRIGGLQQPLPLHQGEPGREQPLLRQIAAIPG